MTPSNIVSVIVAIRFVLSIGLGDAALLYSSPTCGVTSELYGSFVNLALSFSPPKQLAARDQTNLKLSTLDRLSCKWL